MSPDDPRLATGFGSLVDLEKIMESLGEDVVRLDDDVVDGVDSWRYGASHTRMLDTLVESMEAETDPDMKEMLNEQIGYLRESGITDSTEIWIWKDDYLLRQINTKQTRIAVGYVEFGFPNVAIPEGTRFTITAAFAFTDFNEPVEIEPPTVLVG